MTRLGPLPLPRTSASRGLHLLRWVLILATVFPASLLAQGDEVQEGPGLVVLVRHAERDGPSASDPGLTAVGAERAGELARLLSGAGITRIHVSDTRRARETARPLAEALGVEMELYDPRRLGDMALLLRAAPGRHLVVGHSNTTDELSELLGGTSYGPIVEEWEYDRLYFLTPRPGGGMTTVMIRFGPVPVREEDPSS